MAQKTVKYFLIHIGLIFLVFLCLAYLFFYVYLPKSTHHGEVIDVPNLKGKTLKEVESVIGQLRYEVFDSTYYPQNKPLTVISQFPKGGEKVKENRTIYISISSVNPPLVKMPALVSNSLKAAEMTLRSYGLVVGQVRYMPNPNAGVVINQYNGEQSIEPGTPVKKGTAINLLVSSGLSDTEVELPNLLGATLEDAKSLLRTQGLELGLVIYDDESDLEAGLIIKQKPEVKANTANTLRVGEIVDIWIAGAKP